MIGHTLLSLSEHAAVLAQVDDIKPIQPPGASGLVKIVGWLAWAVSIAGVAALVYAGGRFAWERYHGGALEAPKIVLGTLIGGVIATSAGPIMNAVIAP